ncbi:NAD(P)-binding protein [Cylindrobasidium torrendii FP15055 ss-10]|uniref:NAD(P)-binding protein n=1 Tax=Cylindrobasidium torrendii FP15055 ss-10 TaxID=1314674 RepID=A0A0D7BQ63_9AGAR|nr:NAD(P)-binding protein [Cylindrobasidium torrendii FP15055 ss-10]
MFHERESAQQTDRLRTSISPNGNSVPAEQCQWDPRMPPRLAVTKYMSEAVGDDDDLFEAGCDSIQAVSIRNGICGVMHHHFGLPIARYIPHNVVYTNPSVRQLAYYIAELVEHGKTCVSLSATSGRVALMEELRTRYAAHFPPKNTEPASTSGCVVMLTGSTGALGCHILEQLMGDPDVAKVYALNRPDAVGNRSVYIRQAAAFKERQMDYTCLNSQKLSLLEGSLVDENFGLEEEVYTETKGSLTCIIHCAWPTSFGPTCSSMESMVLGTRRLVDFALSIPGSPLVIFCSTAGIFNNWPTGLRAQEEPLLRPSVAIGLGCCEAKWVAECILVEASKAAGLRASVARLSQLTGSSNGAWNAKEWVPSIVLSAKVAQCVPRPPGLVSWLRPQEAAAAILELRHSPRPFVHLAHPRPVPAELLFSAVARRLGVPMVEYTDWLTALDLTIRTRPSTSLTLMDFYRSIHRPLKAGEESREAFGLPSLDLASAFKSMPKTLGEIEPLDAADVDLWIAYWRRIGALGE